MIENNKGEYIKLLLVIFVAYLLISQFIILNAQIPTTSMESTIMAHDRIYFNRLAYIFVKPDRGDIVVFPKPNNKQVLLVKRIIGLPNEVIQIKNGVIYINGVSLKKDYTSNKINGSFGPYNIPDNSYFMLGDNRNNSYDSRYWEKTFINEKDILGKAVFSYFPKIKILK